MIVSYDLFDNSKKFFNIVSRIGFEDFEKERRDLIEPSCSEDIERITEEINKRTEFICALKGRQLIR